MYRLMSALLPDHLTFYRLWKNVMILWNSVFCVMTRGIFLPLFLPLSPVFLTRNFDDLTLFGSDWLDPTPEALECMYIHLVADDC